MIQHCATKVHYRPWCMLNEGQTPTGAISARRARLVSTEQGNRYVLVNSIVTQPLQVNTVLVCVPHHVHQLLNLRRVCFLRIRHRRRRGHAAEAAGVEHAHEARKVGSASPRCAARGSAISWQSTEEISCSRTLELLHRLGHRRRGLVFICSHQLLAAPFEGIFTA